MPRDVPATPDFTPDRATGLARLEAFLPHAGRHYASHRNADFGPDDRTNVSVLSPFIRHRLLLETEVLDAVLGRFALSTAEKFVQEVFWRTYFKGWLEQRPTVWATYRDDLEHWVGELESSGGLRKRYAQAVDGRTGIDCFDAWARELVETGYLHNHARMWFASIWIFTLDLPWTLGADFFYRHLMDGDPASNTLSWRWVGGLHTKGKTYLARPDNIKKYTAGRFAPHGQLAASAPPLDEPHQHGKRPLRPAADRRPDTPHLVLITEDDCAVETLDTSAPAPAALLALSATDARSPLAVGEVARTFADGALADAARRASAHFERDRPDVQSADDWAGVIIDSARAAGVDTVATAYAPVGPVQTKLGAAHEALEAAGIRLIEVGRPLDTIAWPHAQRGFFALKTKIPDILEELERTRAPLLL